MSYVTPFETGASPSDVSHPGEVLIRKVTQSQGARSEYYETREATGKEVVTKPRDRAATSIQRRVRPSAGRDVAVAEHVERLLRECRHKSDELVESFCDPVGSALAGSSLVSLLRELWNYRTAREEDWAELLNILQLVVAKQEFEKLSQVQRGALAAIFREGLTLHTVGPREISRSLEALTAAGFDVWRGIEDFEPKA